MITYLLFSLSLFLLTVPHNVIATIITSDQTLSYTNQYTYGYWSITVQRLNGTNPVTLCTTTDSNINLWDGYYEIDSNSVCYVESSTYQISTIGVNHWNALKITRTEYPYPLIQLREGVTNDVFKKGENQTKYYTFAPNSGISLVQIFLVPQSPFLQSQTYSLNLLTTSCYSQKDYVSVSKFPLPPNNLEIPGIVQLCTYGSTGNYYFSVFISSPPNNDSYTIYFNMYPTSPPTLTTTNGAQVQVPLYKTTWFQYTPSTPDTSFNSVTYTQTHPFRGSATYTTGGSNICYGEQSQTVDTVYNPTQSIVTNLDPCIDGILMSVTPLASLNQNDTEMDGIIFNTASYVPPVTVISQKGAYTLNNNTAASYFRVNIPLPSTGYILLNLSSPITKSQPHQVLFSGDYLVNNTDVDCNVTSYMCNFEGGFFCTINYPTCKYYGKNLYFTILNIQLSGGSFNIDVIDINSPSTPSLQSNNTGQINSVTKYFSFNNIPPSIILSSSSINMALYVPNLCENPIYFESSYPLVCIPDGILSISSNTPTTYDITLQEYNPIPLVIDTGVTATFPKNSLSLLFHLNVPSATSLTFTIVQNSNNLYIQFGVAYYLNDCKSQGFFDCFDEDSHSCSISLDLPASDFYFVVQPTTTLQNSNIMVNVSRNIPMCRNITQDLSFCAGNYPAKSGQLFQLTTEGVKNVEEDAITGYNELIAIWPMCNQTIVDIVCQTNFQEYICGNPGNELCADQCLSTLNSQCGDRTLCGEPVCLSITHCYTPSPPSSGHRTGLGLWVCFFVGLVGVAWF